MSKDLIINPKKIGWYVSHKLKLHVLQLNCRNWFCREAQQTDAGQLTRTLLLEPRATVNVKPNLQIIADDVKCSHGAAISDLEENQLFYFQARGVDLQAARKALIFSFAAEVIERFPNPSIQKKAESHVKKLLDPKLSSWWRLIIVAQFDSELYISKTMIFLVLKIMEVMCLRERYVVIIPDDRVLLLGWCINVRY